MKSTKIHLRKKEPPISSTASLSSVSSHAFPNDGNLLVRFQSTKSIIKSLIGCLEHLNCYRKANDVIQNVPEEIAMSIEPEDPGGDQPDNFSNDSDFDRMLERARLFLYNTSNDSMTVPNFPENDLDHMLEQASICLCNPWQAFPLKRVLIEFPIESSIKYVQITCGGGVKMVLVSTSSPNRTKRSSYFLTILSELIYLLERWKGCNRNEWRSRRHGANESTKEFLPQTVPQDYRVGTNVPLPFRHQPFRRNPMCRTSRTF